jgi:NADH pyrophosphatase NudC (nudix superfamily)
MAGLAGHPVRAGARAAALAPAASPLQRLRRSVALHPRRLAGPCEACNSEHYPRTDQAVIVAVTDGERLLLGRQASWPPRRWSVVAGFVEPGETLEQTVVREVHEETGVRVHADTARYVASQPWPFPAR